MQGVQEFTVRDLYDMAANKYKKLDPKFSVSFFEIYFGKAYDLLNNRAELQILEDKNNKIQIRGLEEVDVGNEDELNQAIEYGNSV